ncbi:hypothetical protein LTR08_001913 [Meristemomyces frigidus]|nr:hypothetical protein LTR08_001913 [Meristemomyces frigidus]
MGIDTAPKYTFAIPTSPAPNKELCCDASHQPKAFVTRYGCAAPNVIHLWHDGSYALVHKSNKPIAPGYLIRQATTHSLSVLRKRIEDECAKKATDSGSVTAARVSTTSSPAPGSVEHDRTLCAIAELEQQAPAAMDIQVSNEVGWEYLQAGDTEDDWEVIDCAVVAEDEFELVGNDC